MLFEINCMCILYIVLVNLFLKNIRIYNGRIKVEKKNEYLFIWIKVLLFSYIKKYEIF